MPIQEVVSEPSDTISLACKTLKREEFWYCELCAIYPYGLNDNVSGVGNVSSKGRHTRFNVVAHHCCVVFSEKLHQPLTAATSMQ